MTLNALRKAITTPCFFSYQLPRIFPTENPTSVRLQLSRWTRSASIIRLKRGTYIFPDRRVDELVLGSLLYQPSYVSLETALNLHGVIPDIPARITSVTSITTNVFVTARGTFSYSRIDKKLYFGFTKVTEKDSGLFYNLAEPEKALLDWIYVRKIHSLETDRVDVSALRKERLTLFGAYYPAWVRKSVYE